MTIPLPWESVEVERTRREEDGDDGVDGGEEDFGGITGGSMWGSGDDGISWVWTLRNLALKRHDGCEHLALYETLSLELGKTKYDAVAYDLIESMTIQTADSIIACQLSGVILAAAAKAGCV